MKILFQHRNSSSVICRTVFSPFSEQVKMSPIRDTLPPGVRRFTMRRRGKTECSWVEAKAFKATKSTGSQGTGEKLMTVENVSLEQ